FIAQLNNINIVKILLANGADINAKDKNNATAFHYAAKAGHADMLYFLYYHGIKINATTTQRETALHWAVIGSQIACIEVLLTLDTPIDLTIKNEQSKTAEMLIKNHLRAAQKIQLANAFTRKQNEYKSTPLHLAVIEYSEAQNPSTEKKI